MIAFSAVVMVKFDFEAVSAVAVACYLCERGVALCTNGDVFVRFVVNHHRARCVFFTRAGADKTVPVVHYNIYCVYGGGVKQARFISHNAFSLNNTEAFPMHKQHGQYERDGKYDAANPVNIFVR